MGFFTPDTDAPSRPSLQELQSQSDPDARERILYLRSYLAMRSAIGGIGVIMPFALFFGSVWLEHTWRPRGSLSAYYHSGVRDAFVATLFATGVFLITYKVFQRTLENTLSTLAGVFVMTVALFPTSRP